MSGWGDEETESGCDGFVVCVEDLGYVLGVCEEDDGPCEHAECGREPCGFG